MAQILHRALTPGRFAISGIKLKKAATTLALVELSADRQTRQLAKQQCSNGAMTNK